MTNSQNQAILSVLLKSPNKWVPLFDILTARGPMTRIASHTRRISDLRKQGYVIENKTEWVDGVVHSWYRIVVEDQGELELT